MYVYAMKLTNGWDNESSFCVYGDERSADLAARDVIEHELSSRGFDDPDCPEHYQLFEEIVSCFKQDDIPGAVELWNDIPDATNDYENHLFVEILMKEVCTHGSLSSKKPEVVVAVSKVIALEEKPCKGCGRKNFTDVKECWCCGNAPW